MATIDGARAPFPLPRSAQKADWSGIVPDGVGPRIVVVGLGNILRQDDGAGVRVIERVLARRRLPPSIAVLDGGVLGLELLAYLEGATHWLIVDAVHTGHSPGTVVRLANDEIPIALPMRLSLHEAGVLDLLSMARLRGSLPAQVVLWGVEPAAIEWSMELTPVVAAALDALVIAVEREALAWL